MGKNVLAMRKSKKTGKKLTEEKIIHFQRQKKMRNINATIFSEAVHSASQEATQRMKSFMQPKKEELKTAAVVKILKDKYYSKWDREELLQVYSQTRAELLLFIRKEL